MGKSQSDKEKKEEIKKEFDGVWEDYLKDTLAYESHNTLKNRISALRQFQEHTGLEKVENIEHRTIKNWSRDLLTDGYAPRTVRNKVYCITGLLDHASNINEIEENPTNYSDLQKLTKTEINSLTDSRYLKLDEYDQMKAACENLRDAVLIQLLWDTGVRAQEATRIRIGDIDRKEQKIDVETGKTKKHQEDERRDVYYTKKFELLLIKWIDKGAREGFFHTTTKEDEEHLLVTEQAPKMAVSRVNETVKKIAEKAGIQEELSETDVLGRSRYKITSHTFRHSFAVHRVKQSMPIAYLQRLLGHSDVSQTREYLQFRDDDIKEAYHQYKP